MNLADLRREYSKSGLRRDDLDLDPIAQFKIWFAQAMNAQLIEPSAITLATADAGGRPSARIVLLKSVDERGFTFFTNYESRKGRELAVNPHAALVCYWAELEREVLIAGEVTKVSREESAEYFAKRPRGSQLGAWVSKQSSVVQSRTVLESELAQVEARFVDREVDLPPYWGGYVLNPSRIEFWQGRPNRLHDRFQYTRQPGGLWRIERLSP
jgi:pyridoxamine 5'-phosphate oxidase